MSENNPSVLSNPTSNNGKFNPVYAYVCMCICVSLIQMVILYFKSGTSPNITSTLCNSMCSISCALIIFCLTTMLGTGLAWGCALLLIIFMLGCCSATLAGSSLAKYSDPLSLASQITGASTTKQETPATSS